MTKTPWVSSTTKGGASNRVEPIGGSLGFEGIEADTKVTVDEISAFLSEGSIVFNTPSLPINEGPVTPSTVTEPNQWFTISPDQPLKVVGTLLEKTGNLVPDIVDAGKEIFQQVTGVGLQTEKKLDTEEVAKKKHDAAVTRRTIAGIEEMLRQASQQNLEQNAKYAIMNEVNLDEVGATLNLGHMNKAEVLTKSHIFQAATIKTERQKAAKKASETPIAAGKKAAGPVHGADVIRDGENRNVSGSVG